MSVVTASYLAGLDAAVAAGKLLASSIPGYLAARGYTLPAGTPMPGTAQGALQGPTSGGGTLDQAVQMSGQSTGTTGLLDSTPTTTTSSILNIGTQTNSITQSPTTTPVSGDNETNTSLPNQAGTTTPATTGTIGAPLSGAKSPSTASSPSNSSANGNAFTLQPTTTPAFQQATSTPLPSAQSLIQQALGSLPTLPSEPTAAQQQGQLFNNNKIGVFQTILTSASTRAQVPTLTTPILGK